MIELLSPSDGLAEAKRKMESWIANGAKLAWLADPENRSVLVYDPDQPVRIVTKTEVVGTGPVEGFVLDPVEVWSLYED